MYWPQEKLKIAEASAEAELYALAFARKAARSLLPPASSRHWDLDNTATIAQCWKNLVGGHDLSSHKGGRRDADSSWVESSDDR